MSKSVNLAAGIALRVCSLLLLAEKTEVDMSSLPMCSALFSRALENWPNRGLFFTASLAFCDRNETKVKHICQSQDQVFTFLAGDWIPFDIRVHYHY